eukprot:7916641-Alexandrium_andersonii.AAC.1
MLDGYDPPDWMTAFAGDDAEAGTIALHASAEPEQVWRDAERMAAEYQLNDYFVHYMRTLPA